MSYTNTLEVLNKPIFNNFNNQSLKVLSYDSANCQYLVNCNEIAIDFDEVKNTYRKNKANLSDCIKSADALMSIGGICTLIEFKNKKLNNKYNQLHEKALHSLIIFCEITGKTADYTGNNLDFILVYRKDKNKASLNNIHNSMSRLSGKKILYFGLDKIPKSFFRHITMMTEKEFEACIQKY